MESILPMKLLYPINRDRAEKGLFALKQPFIKKT